MTGLALAILIYFGAAFVWDLVDRDAVTVKFNSIFRLLCAFVCQVAIIVLCLIILL